METKDVLKWIMLPLAVIMAVVLFGCSEDPINEGKVPSDTGIMVGPEGGIITSMNGDIVITIPQGALNASVKFSVHDLMYKSAKISTLKTIVVEPLVVFNSPAQLTLNYDNCLPKGFEMCQAKSISFWIWDDEYDFIHQIAPTVCSSCNIDTELHTICNCIGKTGVISVMAEW